MFLQIHRVLACLLPAMLTTTTASGAAGPIDLQRALTLSAERNPTLIAGRHGKAIGDALIEQAGYRPNPTVDVSLENFAGSGAFRDVRGLEGTVQASQTLERGGKRAKRIAVATLQQEIAARELAVHRHEILTETAAAFIEAVASRQRLTLAQEPRELAQRTVEAVESRIEAGMAPVSDLARARAAVVAAAVESDRHDSALANASAALAAQWGATDEIPEIPDVHIVIPAALPDREALLARIAAHPSLALEETRLAETRAELAVQQAQAAGDVTVGAGVRWLRPDNDAALVASVSVPLPFQHRNQGNIRAARETALQSEQLVRAAEARLRVRFAAAWRELEASHRAATRLRAEALPATEDAAKSVREAYDQGQLPLMDVLDGQRALVQLRRDLLELDFAYADALMRVEALTGSSFPLTRQLLSQP